jgi:hypothetical protein
VTGSAKRPVKDTGRAAKATGKPAKGTESLVKPGLTPSTSKDASTVSKSTAGKPKPGSSKLSKREDEPSPTARKSAAEPVGGPDLLTAARFARLYEKLSVGHAHLGGLYRGELGEANASVAVKYMALSQAYGAFAGTNPYGHVDRGSVLGSDEGEGEDIRNTEGEEDEVGSNSFYRTDEELPPPRKKAKHARSRDEDEDSGSDSRSSSEESEDEPPVPKKKHGSGRKEKAGGSRKPKGEKKGKGKGRRSGRK